MWTAFVALAVCRGLTRLRGVGGPDCRDTYDAQAPNERCETRDTPRQRSDDAGTEAMPLRPRSRADATVGRVSSTRECWCDGQPRLERMLPMPPTLPTPELEQQKNYLRHRPRAPY